MKAMIMSDLLIAKKYLLQQLGVSIAVGIFITVMIGNLYVAAPMVGVMIPFSLTITILALDERANWQQFRLALPMSRSNVIAGRYVSFALLALLGIAAGLLVTLVMVAVAQIAPGVPQLADLMMNFSWQAMLFASVAGLAIILVMLSVTMPLFSRFGMTKGVRYLPLLIIIGVFFAFQLDGNGPPPEFVANVLNLLESPAGTIAIAAGVLAITAAVYAISAAISTKLYHDACRFPRFGEIAAEERGAVGAPCNGHMPGGGQRDSHHPAHRLPHVPHGAHAHAAARPAARLGRLSPGFAAFASKRFAVGFDAAGVVSFAAGTFALTIAMFSVLLPFMFADSHRKLASYIPFAFMLALMGWIYAFRSMNFDAFLPLVGRIVVAAQSLGGALVVGGCVTAAALALYVVSERAAVRGYATRDL